jgi:predicted secreted protein
MAITSGLVLYAVIWFLSFLVIIPIRLETQADKGHVVPGTHSSAPENHYLKQKAIITTGVAAVLWAVIAGIILSEVISVNDFDWLDVYPDPQ